MPPDLADEIAKVYRTVIWSATDPEYGEDDKTLSEIHREAGQAVVGWLILAGYIVPDDRNREAVIEAWLESEEATSREHAEYLWETMVTVQEGEGDEYRAHSGDRAFGDLGGVAGIQTPMNP